MARRASIDASSPRRTGSQSSGRGRQPTLASRKERLRSIRSNAATIASVRARARPASCGFSASETKADSIGPRSPRNCHRFPFLVSRGSVSHKPSTRSTASAPASGMALRIVVERLSSAPDGSRTAIWRWGIITWPSRRDSNVFELVVAPSAKRTKPVSPASTPRRRVATANAAGVRAPREPTSARPRLKITRTSASVAGRAHNGVQASPRLRPASSATVGAAGPITNGKAPSDRVRAPRRRDTPPANRSIPSQARTIAQGEICPSRAGFWPLLNTLFASLNHEAACSFSIKSVTGFPSSHAWRSLSVSTCSPEADLRWRSFAAFFQPSANLRLPAFPPLPSSGLKKSRAAGTMCASSLLSIASSAVARNSATGSLLFAFVPSFCLDCQASS